MLYNGEEGYGRGSAGEYLLRTLIDMGDTTKLSWYFDTYRTDGAALLHTVSDTQSRLSTLYAVDPASFLTALCQDASGDVVLSKALENTEGLSPYTLLANLKFTNSGQTGYQDFILSEIIDYNKFYLAEHHMYGSSRLGIRAYYPSQYAFEIDASKTLAENEALLASSQFSYRRPWYSHSYNSLISATALEPWGQGSTMSLFSERTIGMKRYELTNHLGNVMAVVSDKVEDVTADPTVTTLPALGKKNPVPLALYDYYPFGMLMPQRYWEDPNTPCIFVTRTVWTKVLVPVKNIYFIDAIDETKFTALEGSTLETSPKDGDIPGSMRVSKTGAGTQAAAESELSGSLMGGKEVVVQARLSNNTGTEGAVRADLVFIPQGSTDEIVLQTAEVRFEEDIRMGAIMPGTGNLRVVFRTTGWLDNPQFRIRFLEYYTIDEVSHNEVVKECSVDANGLTGSDYRFGFNGQMKVNEIAGAGNWTTAQFWEYNTRTGIRANPDPVKSPFESPYATNHGNPIKFSDPDGDTPGDDPKGSVSVGLTVGSSNASINFNASVTQGVGNWEASAGVGVRGVASFYNTGKSGVELRGSVMGGFNDGHTSAQLGTNIWGGFGGMKDFKQRTGIMSFKSGDFSASYENDGTPFNMGSSRGGAPWLGDGHDSYRTAAVRLGYKDFSAGFNLFTGFRSNYKDDDKQVACTGNFGERMPRGLVAEEGPRYRMGIAYMGYGQTQIGLSNDRYIRHPIQDIFAHSVASKQPGFESLSNNSTFFWQHSTGKPGIRFSLYGNQ